MEKNADSSQQDLRSFFGSGSKSERAPTADSSQKVSMTNPHSDKSIGFYINATRRWLLGNRSLLVRLSDYILLACLIVSQVKTRRTFDWIGFLDH